MINLLPPEAKETYRYARRNHTLLHWVIACTLSLAGGAVLAGGGYLYLNQAIAQTNKQISVTNQQLESEHIDDIQKQVTTISNNLKLTVQVLSQEVLFSKLLQQLASVMPSNAVLTNLTFAPQAETGVDVTAQTTDYAAATQLQVNLADPKNQIFSKADIVSISCSNGSSNAKYPCSVTLRALFSGYNPFLFINDGKKGK